MIPSVCHSVKGKTMKNIFLKKEVIARLREGRYK